MEARCSILTIINIQNGTIIEEFPAQHCGSGCEYANESFFEVALFALQTLLH